MFNMDQLEQLMYHLRREYLPTGLPYAVRELLIANVVAGRMRLEDVGGIGHAVARRQFKLTGFNCVLDWEEMHWALSVRKAHWATCSSLDLDCCVQDIVDEAWRMHVHCCRKVEYYV